MYRPGGRSLMHRADLASHLLTTGKSAADSLTGTWRADPPHGTDATLLAAASSAVAMARLLLAGEWRELDAAEVEAATAAWGQSGAEVDEWRRRVLSAASEDATMRRA